MPDDKPSTDPSSYPVTRADLLELLQPLNTTINELKQENARLREELISKEKVGFAENIPGHLRTDDALVDPADQNFARRVTLGTRAAIPGKDKHIIAPGNVVQNSKSRPWGE